MARSDLTGLVGTVIGTGLGAGVAYVILRPRLVEPVQRIADLERALAEVQAQRDKLAKELERTVPAQRLADMERTLAGMQAERDRLAKEMERAVQERDRLASDLEACRAEAGRVRIPTKEVPKPPSGTILAKVLAPLRTDRSEIFWPSQALRAFVWFRVAHVVAGGCSVTWYRVRLALVQPGFQEIWEGGTKPLVGYCTYPSRVVWQEGRSPSIQLAQGATYRIELDALGVTGIKTAREREYAQQWISEAHVVVE